MVTGARAGGAASPCSPVRPVPVAVVPLLAAPSAQLGWRVPRRDARAWPRHHGGHPSARSIPRHHPLHHLHRHGTHPRHHRPGGHSSKLPVGRVFPGVLGDAPSAAHVRGTFAEGGGGGHRSHRRCGQGRSSRAAPSAGAPPSLPLRHTASRRGGHDARILVHRAAGQCGAQRPAGGSPPSTPRPLPFRAPPLFAQRDAAAATGSLLRRCAGPSSTLPPPPPLPRLAPLPAPATLTAGGRARARGDRTFTP